MEQTNLSIRVSRADKKDFENFCSDVGMNVSVAVNMFIKAVLRENKLPFDVTNDPIYSKESMNRLRNSIADLNAGNKITKTIEELEAMENE